jgi:hypothetical protein
VGKRPFDYLVGFGFRLENVHDDFNPAVREVFEQGVRTIGDDGQNSGALARALGAKLERFPN